MWEEDMVGPHIYPSWYSSDAPQHNVAKIINNNRLEFHTAHNFGRYATSIARYTKRRLTVNSDIIEAYRGILNITEHSFRGAFIFGLPTTEMDDALLWMPAFSLRVFSIRDFPLRRRINLKTGVPEFPSWTWAGWEGAVEYPAHFQNQSTVRWVDGLSDSLFTTDEYRTKDSAHNSDSWEAKLAARCPYYVEKNNPEVGFLHPTECRQEYHISQTYLSPGTKLLRFEALCASLEVFHSPEWHLKYDADEVVKLDPSQFSCSNLFIKDAKGVAIGEVEMQVPCTKIMAIKSLSLSKSTCQFIALSRTHPNYVVADSALVEQFGLDQVYGPAEKRREGFKYTGIFGDRTMIWDWTNTRGIEYARGFDYRWYEPKPWCTYNVMMVEWVHNIAYRLGLGKCHVDGFHQGNPQRKIITLG
jgi:hypothetical protein